MKKNVNKIYEKNLKSKRSQGGEKVLTSVNQEEEKEYHRKMRGDMRN